MRVFFQSFFKILGFFLAFFVFLIIISIFLKLINNRSNGSYFSYYDGAKKSNNIIAILKISGPVISNPNDYYNFNIFNSQDVIYPQLIENYLNELEKNKILGLIVDINSPGGSVSATNTIYQLFKKYKKRNNIKLYFHTRDILASGGYWISQSGNKIFANYGALIGSIGVKGPDWLYYNSPTLLSSGLFGNSVESPRGIKLFSNTAGVSKDVFNPFRVPSEKETRDLQKIVDNIYNDFVNIIVSNRKIESNFIKNEIGAMVYNSKIAQKMYLIDGQQNIKETIKLMTKELKLKANKIIINDTVKMNFLDLNISSIFFKDRHNLKDKKIITKKFCNNLRNEFSVALLNSYNSMC